MEDLLMTFLVGRTYRFTLDNSRFENVGKVEKIYQKKNKWIVKFKLQNVAVDSKEVNITNVSRVMGPV